MGTAPSEEEIQQNLNETQYFLKRWRFAACASGLLWIQPAQPKLSLEELAAFLTFLRRGCDDNSPRVIRLDFGDIELVGHHWTLAEGLVQDFAAAIHARCRLACDNTGAAPSFLLFRQDADLSVVANTSSSVLPPAGQQPETTE